MLSSTFPPTFYQRPAVVVARELLGARLVRCLNGQRISGWIVETEAYQGESDLACHARAGRTLRTEVMYGPAGRAYIYFIYGIHWMFNVVTGHEGDPNAVLIRALVPHEGIDCIAEHRSARVRRADWTSGPANICQALKIDRQLNGADLTDAGAEIWIEAGLPVADAHVKTGPRVGIDSVPEPWRSMPWRFWVEKEAWGLFSAEALARKSEAR